MLRVAAFYRYPVKGFSPEACEGLFVRHDGRIAGDRVLGVRFANSPVPDEAWSKKHEMLALVNTPALARLRLRFDHQRLRLCIDLEGSILVDEGLDDAGRARIAAAIQDYVLRMDQNLLSLHPDRLPLRVVGDGRTPRYHDSEAGHVTLHSRESLAAVAVAVGDPNLSEQRFRSNIVIDGVAAWEELSWPGRTIRIGQVHFDALSRKGRCVATHVNPKTGKRDLPILSTLIEAFTQDKPHFAIALAPVGAGGSIHVGDPVSIVG